MKQWKRSEFDLANDFGANRHAYSGGGAKKLDLSNCRVGIELKTTEDRSFLLDKKTWDKMVRESKTGITGSKGILPIFVVEFLCRPEFTYSFLMLPQTADHLGIPRCKMTPCKTTKTQLSAIKVFRESYELLSDDVYMQYQMRWQEPSVLGFSRLAVERYLGNTIC